MDDTMNDLHTACYESNFDRVKHLLESNAFNIDKPGGIYSRRTPLMYSCMQNNVAIVELLVQSGASLDAEVFTGRDTVTALKIAILREKYAMMQVLLRGGATVETTALHCAARGRKVGPFEMLVKAGANPGKSDHMGRVPLDIAAIGGRSVLVKWMLLHLGIERCGGQSEGRDALRHAAQCGSVEIMQLLTERKVFSARDFGEALHRAMDDFQENSVKFLLEEHPTKVCHVLPHALVRAVRGYKHGCASSRLTRRLMDAGAKTTNTLLDVVVRLREKETEEKHVKRLDDIYRLLRQEDAVHSRSFLWHLPAATPAVVVRPVRRSREATSRVVVGALSRYTRKTLDA